MISLDPTSTAANSSSPPQTYTSSPANLHYAFLVHSQKTLTQNLPPRVDNKLLARQKRRRTSPEDHAVLEAEYKKNPKPDKVARASIVSQVSLGEKEVQIWFQNRRQNDRRKSKPLEPHELVGPRSSGGISEDCPSSHSSGFLESSSPLSIEQESPEQPGIISFTEEITPKITEKETSEDQPVEIGNHETETSATTALALLGAPRRSSEAGGLEHQIDSSRDIAGLGINVNVKKRRFSNVETGKRAVEDQFPEGKTKSPPSLRISMSFNGEALLRKEGEPTPSPPKARTAVRISLSSDGEALIRTEDEPSPSKNRMRVVPGRVPRQNGLRRSVSAINFNASGSSPVSREGSGMKPFGRSRDARAWESYCDNDARSAISSPIISQSPSSVRAQGLYRSSSHRSLARGSFSKVALSPQLGMSNQRDNAGIPDEKRRKLSRTVSSLGRLESAQQKFHAINSLAQGQKSKNKTSKDYAKDFELEVGDSDKENWVPGTTHRAHPRHQRALSHTQRPVLKENGVRKNTAVDDLALAKHGRLYRGPRGSKEMKASAQTTGKLDAEVAAFMTKAGSASREEDLDCIQGLLSLSQGAWQ